MSPLLSKKRSHHESSEPPEPMRELTSPQFTIVNAIPDKNHHKEQKHPKHHRYLLRRKILMFRTPDADADVDDSDDDDDFRGKQRQFEFQWQLRSTSRYKWVWRSGHWRTWHWNLRRRRIRYDAQEVMSFCCRIWQHVNTRLTLSLPSSCRVSPTVYQIHLTKVPRNCPFLLERPWIDSMPPN